MIHPGRYPETDRNDRMPGSQAREPRLVPRRMSSQSSDLEQSDESTFIESQINPNGTHVWPSNAPRPIDVVFCGVEGLHHPSAKSPDRFEVLYLCSGSATLHVQERSLPFKNGDVAVLGTTCCHDIEPLASKSCELVALLFDPDLIRCDGSSDGIEYLAPFLLQDLDFPHVVPARTGMPSQILEFMLRIRSELPAFSPRACLAVRTYLKTLLLQLVNHYSSYTRTVEIFQQQQRAAGRLRPVFDRLAERSDIATQVSDAARMCGMNESDFKSLFKQLTGVSFMKYVNQYRIQRAQSLLANTDRSIADISLDTGYCDQSYFGAVFRRLVGTTPAAYRRLHHKQYSLEGRWADDTAGAIMSHATDGDV